MRVCRADVRACRTVFTPDLNVTACRREYVDCASFSLAAGSLTRSRYQLQEKDIGFESFIDPEEFEIAADLDEPGQRIVVAQGGVGGDGNAGMRKALRPRAHERHQPHTKGEPGEAALVVLELKTIADVGLVGFPNAGKSTLLGALSKAR